MQSHDVSSHFLIVLEFVQVFNLVLVKLEMSQHELTLYCHQQITPNSDCRLKLNLLLSEVFR